MSTAIDNSPESIDEKDIAEDVAEELCGDVGMESRDESCQEYEQEFDLLALPHEVVLFRHCLPCLRWKDLFRLRSTSKGCQQLVDEYFEQLKHIDLTLVQRSFTENAFQLLTLNCTNLRKLVINEAKWIVDKGLTNVFRNNRSLAFLDLSDCSLLTGACLLPLAVNCKQLHTLILRHCNWLKLGALETLITHLDSMEVVDLTSCTGISGVNLFPLLQKFQKLKELRIAYIHNVTDTTMLHIGRTCGNTLKYLDVVGCRGVTDWGVKMLAEHCMNLKKLHVAGSNVSDSGLDPLRGRGVEVDHGTYSRLPQVPHTRFYVQV